MNKESVNLLRHLSTVALFSDLSEPERLRLAQACRLQRLGRGAMVFRAGDLCNAFYVVLTGQVKLFVSTPSGQEKVIELIGPGNSFAEAIMFLERPYFLNAQALCDTLLMSVGRQAVFDEVQQDPRFAMRMLAGISHRLHGLVQDVQAYALQSGMQRLIGFLLRDVDVALPQQASVVTVSLPVSKATLASRLSMTAEYFSRVLHELEAERLIEIDKREVRILDVQRLANFGSH